LELKWQPEPAGNKPWKNQLPCERERKARMTGETRKPLRILAADDSAVMREVMKTVFAMHAASDDSALPRMELVGVARDGIEALEAVRILKPDLLVLDVDMPRLGGLGVLEHLRSRAPGLPVIMCSAHTERGARVTLDALAQGARDYVMKPGQQRDFAAALDTLMQQLLPRIAGLCGRSSLPALTPAQSSAGPASAVVPLTGNCDPVRVEMIVIGVSTGGPSALEHMLPRLPPSLPVPVLLVQHMPRLFTGELAARLDRLCSLHVLQASDGMQIQPGCVLLAPGDMHMEVARGTTLTQVVRLHHGVALNSCKPSVDYLFNSAARLTGAGTLALIMTGMGQDGLEGARAVRKAGGAVLAQDEASSAVWGMPGRVVSEGLASACVPLESLAEVLVHRVAAGRPNWRTASTAGRSAEKHLNATSPRLARSPASALHGPEDLHGMYR
jgi:two-component system chemotaxis response regulator CheB